MTLVMVQPHVVAWYLSHGLQGSLRFLTEACFAFKRFAIQQGVEELPRIPVVGRSASYQDQVEILPKEPFKFYPVVCCRSEGPAAKT